MKTFHRLIFGDSEDMREMENGSVHLVVTSPPYFNTPFDYPGLFKNYDAYLKKMTKVARELKRAVAPGKGCVRCMRRYFNSGGKISGGGGPHKGLHPGGVWLSR